MEGLSPSQVVKTLQVRHIRIPSAVNSSSSACFLTPQSLQFWNIWAIFFVNAFAVVYISTQYKTFGQTFIEDDKYLSLVGSFSALFNALGTHLRFSYTESASDPRAPPLK